MTLGEKCFAVQKVFKYTVPIVWASTNTTDLSCQGQLDGDEIC